MLKKGLFVVLGLLMLGSLFVTGCAEEEIQESQVVIALWSAPEGLFNPNLSETAYDNYMWESLFARLMRFDPDDDYNLVPDLAESMTISDDNLTITFELRDDVYFHDGVKVTADDVKFTFEWMIHPDYTGVRASNWTAIEGFEAYNSGVADEVTGIQVLDEHTVVFTLSEVDAPSLSQIANWPISPKHRFEGTAIADMDHHEDITAPVGAGPFKFVRYEEGQFIELEAYEKHHIAGRPKLDRIIVKVASIDVALAELLTGFSDIAWVQPNASDFAMFEHAELVIHSMPANAYQYMAIQMKHPILEDKRVRHALTYALDRWAMVDNLFDGMGLVQISHMSSVSWGFDPNLKPRPFNPARAGELLDDAGWVMGYDGYRYRDGQKLSFVLNYPSGNVPRMRNAEIIKEMLGNVGIEIELEMFDFPTIMDKVVGQRDFELCLIGWLLTLEPDPTGIWLSTDYWNIMHFHNERSDELIVKGRATLDQAERQEIYREWQQILVEEAPYVWLYAETEAWVANPRVNGFRPDSFGVYWDVWNWSVEE